MNSVHALALGISHHFYLENIQLLDYSYCTLLIEKIKKKKNIQSNMQNLELNCVLQNSQVKIKKWVNTQEMYVY